MVALATLWPGAQESKNRGSGAGGAKSLCVACRQTTPRDFVEAGWRGSGDSPETVVSKFRVFSRSDNDHSPHPLPGRRGANEAATEFVGVASHEETLGNCCISGNQVVPAILAGEIPIWVYGENPRQRSSNDSEFTGFNGPFCLEAMELRLRSKTWIAATYAYSRTDFM